MNAIRRAPAAKRWAAMATEDNRDGHNTSFSQH